MAINVLCVTLVGGINLFFCGGGGISLIGRGEALVQRAEKDRKWMGGSWGQRAPPHQLGGMGCNVRPEKSLQKCFIMCKSYEGLQKG